MKVRPYTSDDAPALVALFHAAVHEISRLYYSQAQVNAWAPEVPDPARFRARAADGRTVLVAVDESDAPLAYGDVEADGHIDHLFCRPDAAGTGVTAALYAGLEAAARARGIDLLYVEASEPARRFFLKQGFVLIGRHDFEMAGVSIHNFEMEKRLRADRPSG
jgi:putative acetyltransferase